MQYIVVQKLYNDGQPPRVLCAIFLWDLPVPPDHSLSAYYGQRVRDAAETGPRTLEIANRTDHDRLLQNVTAERGAASSLF